MVNYVGKNELFHQSEHRQVLIPANLIQSSLLVRRKKRKLLYLSQRLRHERLGEIEPLLAADNIFHSPADPLRRLKRALIAIIVFHDQSSRNLFAVRRSLSRA